MAAITGTTRRYGTAPPARRRRVRRRRRDHPEAVAAAGSAVGALSLSGLRLVEDVSDAAAGRGRGLLDAALPGEDLGQHRLEDVAVLDVDPVLRLRDEPAARCRPLVDAGAEQIGRVRDVPLRLERALVGGAREVREPGDRLRLRVALQRNGEVRAAE